jgi:hypothetical protein
LHALPTNRPKQTLLKPFDILFSKSARRAYLTTFLVIVGALLLLGLAIVAYTLFYWTYIPRIGFERTIYLQFDNVFRTDDNRFDSAGNPYGVVILSPDIVSTQRYDVQVELMLPRTPDNRDAGNFMLEAAMFAPGAAIDPLKDTLMPGAADADNRLAFSRRPAILSYRSVLVEYVCRLIELPWYLIGWRKEAEKLTVSLWESVEFSRGWRNVPSTLRLDIQSTHRMQIYSAKAMFRAKFKGLRWLMYNHRIISAIVFITGFWVTELLFAGLAWAGLSLYMEPQPQKPQSDWAREYNERIKQENDDEQDAKLSETERTFPTSSKQPILKYESPRIKQEEDDEPVVLPEASSRAIEADDEDEDEDADLLPDSGLGTSMESSTGRRDSVRKRRGRAKSQEEIK